MAKSTSLGIAWDKWTPKIESSITMDLLNLGEPNLTLFVLTDAPAAEVKALKRLVSFLGVTLVDKEPEGLDTVKLYYEDEPPRLDKWYKKVYRKRVSTARKKMSLQPNKPNYPEFPARDRPLPTGMSPNTKPMPPRYGTMILPPWAYNG